MKKKQPQAASQQRRQPATNPKVRLKRSGGSAGDGSGGGSGGDAKKVSSLIQPKSPDLAVLDEKKPPSSRNPRSEVASIGDGAGVAPVRTKRAGSATTATRPADTATPAVVEPPVAEKVRKGTKGVRRNVEMPPVDEKKPAEEPVVRSLRSRAVVVEFGSTAAEKHGGGPPDLTANTRKPEKKVSSEADVGGAERLSPGNTRKQEKKVSTEADVGGAERLSPVPGNTTKQEKKVSTEADVGGAERLSPRKTRKRGRSEDSVEVAEEITAVEPTKGAVSDRRVVSKQAKQGRPKIPLPPRRPTRSTAPDEVSIPASDERMAKKQKLDSAASTKSISSEALKGKVSVIEEAPRRPTRSAIHNEVPVTAFVAKEKVSALEEAPRRSRRSSSIYNPFPVPASVVSGDDERVDAKEQPDSTVLTKPSPSEAKKGKASVPVEPPKRSTRGSAHIEDSVPAPVVSAPIEPPKRSTRGSAHIEVSVPAPVVSASGERAGKKKADSEVEKGKLPVHEEPPKRSTRSSTLDVPGGEIPLPESDITLDDKKLVKTNKRGREITPPKASEEKPPVVKELPRRSRRSSIGGVTADEISLPASDIFVQEEKVVEKKIPGKRVPNRGPKTEAAAAPVEARKVKIPKLEDPPRRATRLSICPVPKHDSSPQNLGDDTISFNKKEKGKQAKKFQPVEETAGNPTPKVKATSEAEKVHRGKVSEYVKPLRRSTLKKESGGKHAQKQRRAKKTSGNSAPTSKAVTKTVEVREESQKVVRPEKPPRQTRHTARDLDVSIVGARKSGDDEVPPRGRGLKRQAAEVTLELKEQKGSKRQKQSGRAIKDQSHLANEGSKLTSGSVEGGSPVKSDTFTGPEADSIAADLSTVVETDTAATKSTVVETDAAATVENDDLTERIVSETQQSSLPDSIVGDELKERESRKSQEENLHVGLDVSPDSELSEKQSGQIEVLSIAREVSISEVVVTSVVVSQGGSNVEVDAEKTKEAASDGDLDFKSDVQCSNAEKEVDSSTMSHVVYAESTGTPSCIASGEVISDEASPAINVAIPSQDCSNVAINVDMTREAALDGDLDFKSDIQEAVKEVDLHTMPHSVYVESIGTPMMDGSSIAPVETILNEANVEGNETTYTIGVPLSLSPTKELPLPEITEAHAESENEEPTVPAITHVAGEISSQLNSCSPVQASCHQEKSIGLLAEPADSNLADLSCTPVVLSSEVQAFDEASPVKNDDAKESIEQASYHQEKLIGIPAKSADSNLEELCRSDVRAYSEALTTPVESEDAKECVGQASLHQEMSIGLLAESADSNLGEVSRTQIVQRSEVQVSGAALLTMVDAYSPVKSEDAKESIGQASCHQEKSSGNQVEALATMSDPYSPVKSEDTKVSIGQASCHQEKNIGNQVVESLITMSDPHSLVKSEDAKESTGQASCHQEKSIGNQVDETLTTISDPHSPVKSEDAKESIGQASCHQEENSFGLLAESADSSNLAELCTQVVPGSEVLGLGVHSPVKSDFVKESIEQASCHQGKSIGLLAEPADGNLELSSTQVVFRSDVQEFSEGLPSMLDVYSPVKNDDPKESIEQARCHQEKSTGLLTEPEDSNLTESQVVFRSEVQEFGEASATMVDAHSPMKSDDTKESIGHAVDVTFTPREVSFGEGIGAEKGMNDDVETESKVSQTLLQDLASDECSDDQIPNNEPGILSENISDDSLIVIDSSSAQEPNHLKTPVDDREPSSSKSFVEGCEIKDIVLEVAEPLNTEVIVDDKDENALPHADVTENAAAFDVTKSGDGFGNVEVTDLESPDCLNNSSVPKFMIGDTSVGELTVVNEGATLPLGVDSKYVDFTETEVADTQVAEFTETEVVSTQVVDAEPYESASKVVEFTETEVVITQVVDAEPYESASKVVEYVGNEVVDTQVVDEEPNESASKFVEPTENEVLSTQAVDEEPYESASQFVEYTETEVISTQVIDAEPYESAISGDGSFTDVIQYEDDGKSNKIPNTAGMSFSCRPAEDVEVTVLGSPGDLNSSSVAKVMNVAATSGERSTEDENADPLSLSVDKEFDKHTEVQVLSRDVTDAEPYESTIHGIGNSTVLLPNDDDDKHTRVTSTSGTSSFWEPAEDDDVVVLGTPGSNISPVAEDKAGATSPEKLSADSKFDRNAETQVFSSHFVGTEPYESIDAIQYEGGSLSCEASEHGRSSFTDVLPSGDGDKYNEGTQTVGVSLFSEPAEHCDENVTAVLTPDDGDKCIEETSNVSASISYGPAEQSVNNPTEELPYEGDGKSNEITPTIGASVSCGFAEHDTNNLIGVILNEDGERCNEITVTVDASLSSCPAEGGVGNIIDADGASISTGPVDASFSSRPAEEGVDNIIKQDLDNLPDVLPYEGDDKCNEVTVTVDAFSSDPAEDAVGNIIDQDIENLPDDKCNEVTVTVDAFSSGHAEEAVGNIIDQVLENLPDDKCNEVTVSVDAFSSGPAEDAVGNIIDQNLENLPDVIPNEGDDKCHEATPAHRASFFSRPAECGVGNIINQDPENLSDVLPHDGDDKCQETTPASSRLAEEGVGNITVQDLESLPDVLPNEGDDKCNEVAVSVDAFSSGPAEDGVGNIIEHDFNNPTDVLLCEGGSKCNEATVTVDASLSSKPADDGDSNMNDVFLYEDHDKCSNIIPTVGESISSGPAEHDLENFSDVVPFEDGKKYNDVTSTVGVSLSCTPAENVDGNFTDVLRYDVGDKSNEGTSTFGAFSSRPVEHDDGNLTDVLPYDEGDKSNEGTIRVGTSEDLQVTALVNPCGFDNSSVAEASYIGTSLSQPAEAVEVTAMEVTAEEDLDGSKISSDSNPMAFVTSEEELTMQAVNAEPHESAILGNNEGDDKCNEVSSYIGTSFSAGPTESVEATTVEVTTVEVTTVEVTTVEVTTVEATDVEDPGLKITSDSDVMAGASSEGELNIQVVVAEPSESTIHGNSEGGDKFNEVANYVDALESSGLAEITEVAAVEDPALKTSSDLNVTVDATSEGEISMQKADAEPSESTIHGNIDVGDKCNDVATDETDVGSSFSPRPVEVVEVTALDDPGLEINSDFNVMAGVPAEAELSMKVADTEPFESAIHGNSEGGGKRIDVTSHVGTSISSEPAEVVDVVAVEDPGLNISSDSNVTVGATSTGELMTDSKE